MSVTRPMRLLAAIFLSVMWVAGAGRVAAQDMDPAYFEQRLKTYDPALVEAARTYARTVNIAEQLAKAAPTISEAVADQVKEKNPSLSASEVKAFTDAFFNSAFVEHKAVLENMTLLMMLDTFTKDEMVALSQFYSSPVGLSILQKMPRVLNRMPEVMAMMEKYTIPEALRAAQDKMKKNGVDVKL